MIAARSARPSGKRVWGRAAEQALAPEGDPAGRALDQAHHGLHRRGLAGAVAADQRQDLALAHVEAASCRTWLAPYHAFRFSTSSMGRLLGRAPSQIHAPDLGPPRRDASSAGSGPDPAPRARSRRRCAWLASADPAPPARSPRPEVGSASASAGGQARRRGGRSGGSRGPRSSAPSRPGSPHHLSSSMSAAQAFSGTLIVSPVAATIRSVLARRFAAPAGPQAVFLLLEPGLDVVAVDPGG